MTEFDSAQSGPAAESLQGRERRRGEDKREEASGRQRRRRREGRDEQIGGGGSRERGDSVREYEKRGGVRGGKLETDKGEKRGER